MTATSTPALSLHIRKLEAPMVPVPSLSPSSPSCSAAEQQLAAVIHHDAEERLARLALSHNLTRSHPLVPPTPPLLHPRPTTTTNTQQRADAGEETDSGHDSFLTAKDLLGQRQREGACGVVPSALSVKSPRSVTDSIRVPGGEGPQGGTVCGEGESAARVTASSSGGIEQAGSDAGAQELRDEASPQGGEDGSPLASRFFRGRSGSGEGKPCAHLQGMTRGVGGAFDSSCAGVSSSSGWHERADGERCIEGQRSSSDGETQIRTAREMLSSAGRKDRVSSDGVEARQATATRERCDSSAPSVATPPPVFQDKRVPSAPAPALPKAPSGILTAEPSASSPLKGGVVMGELVIAIVTRGTPGRGAALVDESAVGDSWSPMSVRKRAATWNSGQRGARPAGLNACLDS